MNTTKQLLISTCAAMALSAANGQQILLVNDNDYITYNTDTIVSSLLNSAYSEFDYWSVPDSGGNTPGEAFLLGYDLVIWYASTDGFGLGFWNDGAQGNDALVGYALSGAPLWVIGEDVLFAQYGPSAGLAAGDFAYDFMGLASYDTQSYVDDGGTGVPQLDRLPAAPASFPETLTWVFDSLWYVDGCTPRPGTLAFYEMGPDDYALSGELSMFHHTTGGLSVMSEFFDPALLDTHETRVAFLEACITYLLDTGTAVTNLEEAAVAVYPNPASDWIAVNTLPEYGAGLQLLTLRGEAVFSVAVLPPGWNRLQLSGLPAGVYLGRFINGQTFRVCVNR
jgi:hypothetical protein